MDIVIDTLLIIFAILVLFGMSFVGYALVSRKMLTINPEITRTIWLLSTAFVILAPFLVPIKIDTLEQMNTMKFGVPAYFVEQHFFAADADLVFPYYTTLANEFGYSLRTAISINPLRYAVDVFLCYVIFAFLFRMLRKALRRRAHA